MKGLLFKEWKMLKGFMIGMFVVLILFHIMAVINSVPDGVASIMMFAIAAVPLTVLYSLNTEAIQIQLFLHNPRSIHQLLLVKVINAMIIAATYLFLSTVVFTIWKYVVDYAPAASVMETFSYLLFISFVLLLFSLYPTVIVIFLWTIHRLIRKVTGGSIGFILVVILLVVGNELMMGLRGSSVYGQLTNWGEVSHALVIDHGAISPFVFFDHIYIGVILFHTLVGLLIYFGATYVLDRKVEVR